MNVLNILAAIDLNAAMGAAASIINKFGLLAAFGALMAAILMGMNDRHHGGAKTAMVAAALLGLSWTIVHAFFAAGGQDAAIELIK